MIEQRTVKTIDTQKNIWEYTTEELKSILGNFENEYNENATGEVINNEILGFVKQGTIDHALKIGAIIKKGKNYFVRLPEFREYRLKHNALREIIGRRDYAHEQNNS